MDQLAPSGHATGTHLVVHERAVLVGIPSLEVVRLLGGRGREGEGWRRPPEPWRAATSTRLLPTLVNVAFFPFLLRTRKQDVFLIRCHCSSAEWVVISATLDTYTETHVLMWVAERIAHAQTKLRVGVAHGLRARDGSGRGRSIFYRCIRSCH